MKPSPYAKYGVVPDLSREQRDIKEKLVQYGKYLVDKHEVELVVKLKSSSVIFFEALCRLHSRTHPTWSAKPSSSAHSPSGQTIPPANLRKSNSAGAAGSQQTRTTGMFNNKDRTNTHRKSFASNNTQSQTPGGSQSSGFSQTTGTPQSQPSGLSDLLGSDWGEGATQILFWNSRGFANIFRLNAKDSDDFKVCMLPVSDHDACVLSLKLCSSVSNNKYVNPRIRITKDNAKLLYNLW